MTGLTYKPMYVTIDRFELLMERMDRFYLLIEKMEKAVNELREVKHEMKGIKEVNSIIINSGAIPIGDEEKTKFESLDKDHNLNLKIRKNIPKQNTDGLLKDKTMNSLLTDKDTQSDINQYPILYLVNTRKKSNQWHKFGTNLDGIVMESDCILEQERVWNEINMQLMATLGSMNGLKPYNQLTETYNVKLNLIPNTNCTGSNMNQAKNIYDQLSSIMKTKLLNGIIDKDKAPGAYQLLQRYRTLDDGFMILTRIIFGLSSQLGGISEDPQELVGNFKIIDNEHLTDFYFRAIQAQNIINLQNDKTGQKQRLIGIFTQLLYNSKPDYRLDINTQYLECNKLGKLEI